jgi:hypothetical protein
MTDSLHSKTLDDISSVIGSYDVLCGRDKIALNHCGNRRFRIIVTLFLHQYVDIKSTRKDKSRIIQRIMEAVKSCGGRFLITKGTTRNHFVEVSTQKAHEKISHALRDMAASKKVGDDSWMGTSTIYSVSDKISSSKSRSERSGFVGKTTHHSDQLIGKTIKFHSTTTIKNASSNIMRYHKEMSDLECTEGMTVSNFIETDSLDCTLSRTTTTNTESTGMTEFLIENGDSGLNSSKNADTNDTIELTPSMFTDEAELETLRSLQLESDRYDSSDETDDTSSVSLTELLLEID